MSRIESRYLSSKIVTERRCRPLEAGVTQRAVLKKTVRYQAELEKVPLARSNAVVD